MEAVLPIAQPKEDHLSKPTIRIEIPLLSGKNSNAPTIVDIAEVMAKYREQLGESSEDEDYEDGMEEEEGLEGEEDDDEDSDSSDDEEDEEDSLDEIEERELSPSEIENMLPAGPKTNRYTGVIERIERMYGGEYSKGRKQDDYDFEDSFIDDSDWKTYSDAPKTKHDGFFINKGTLELASEESESSAQAFQEGKKKKRKRSLDKDGKEIKAKESSGDAKDKKERPKKKTKTGSADSSPAKEGEGKKGSKIQALTFQSASPSSASSGQFAAPKPKAPAAALSPSVESAIQALERAIPLHPLAEGGKKRLPRELDAHLYQVALEARKTHPHGHIAANVTQRLIKSLPFNERTLKHHMKRVLESKTEEEEESLEAKIDSLLDELKTKVDKMRGLNPTAKWKWDRETGNLLYTIFELVDNRVELHNKLHEKDTELKLSDRKERKKVADEIAKFWPADQMTGADILKKNTIIKSNRKRATGKPDGGSTIEGKEKEKEKEKEKKDGKKDSAQKESKRDTDKSKADKKEKKQQKEEKKKERKEEKKLRKEEKKKSSDKKASGDDRKVAAERKPSPTTAPQPLASPPPPTTAAQAQPSATPIVRQAVPLPPLPSVITRVTAEEDDDVIVLS